VEYPNYTDKKSIRQSIKLTWEKKAILFNKMCDNVKKYFIPNSIEFKLKLKSNNRSLSC
jgi:hypothetical protein